MHSYRIRIWFSLALGDRTSARVLSGLAVIFDNSAPKLQQNSFLKDFMVRENLLLLIATCKQNPSFDSTMSRSYYST